MKMNNDALIIDRNSKWCILKLFGKTSNDLEEDVEYIREWTKTQLHFPEIPSDPMIEYFLVNNKFSLESTKKKIDAYYTSRKTLHEQLGNINPKAERVIAGFTTMNIFPLPKLKDDLYRIIIIRCKPLPSDLFDPVANMANVLNLYEIRMHEDYICGDIVFFDFEHLTLGHIIKVTPSQIKLAVNILESVYSNRLKEIHMYKHPPAIEIALTMTKMFIKKKIMDRLIFHSSLDSVTQHIPLELLPKDYGGDQPYLDRLEELLKEKLEEYGPRFDKLEKMRVNESLRPVPLKHNDQFGIEGSFRKINLD